MTVDLMTAGFSDAAQFVDDATEATLRRLQDSNTFGFDPQLRDELATVWHTCREPNWDGFDALPISEDTMRDAYCLLASLPTEIHPPSVGAEPDGSLTLEWHRGPRRTLSVSVSPDGDLHFAALFGPNRVYGTEAFFGDCPTEILRLIQRIYST